ncbi:ATP-binding protein [Pseudomonas sp. Pseusp122]|uniref:PAS domain-containing sensor histidine kinase n=1 Tax=unclassified Pseudomonas TaxID=196821 RepID=UPI0039A61A38
MMPDTQELPDSESLFEHASCGLLLTLPSGEIKRVNQTFCTWLGMAREALLGRRIQDLLTMGGKIFHQTHWAPLLLIQGSVAEVKLDLRHRDGHSIPMILNVLRREHAGGVFHELSLFIAEDRDKYERELMVARKQAEAALAEQLAVQKELAMAQTRLRVAHAEAQVRASFAEQMVGIVSHDLRNPLTAIRMATGLLNEDNPGPQQSRLLGHIAKSAERAQRMITDLLDFTQARVGSGISVNPAPIDLHALVGQCLDELRMTFADRQIVHAASGLGPCIADSDRLFQLLGNLVGNAMAYGAPDGVVRVTSTIDDNGFSLAVHNSGEPIPEPVLGRLFEPMVRGVEAKDEARSVGLGLFIVREIAKAHQGDVRVVSNAEGGTSFIVRWP